VEEKKEIKSKRKENGGDDHYSARQIISGTLIGFSCHPIRQMTNNLSKNFKWNLPHIIQNRLPEEILDQSNIEKLDDAELFVEHPNCKDYYVSQYGRVISLKRKSAALLGAFLGGRSDRQYLYYGFSEGDKQTISAHRAVADVYCPNFWKPGCKLEAHHIDGNHMHNDYRNLILLPPILHKAIHKIKKIVLFKDGKIIEYKNPLDLVLDTGLTLEEILLANKGKKKPIKSDGKYTVFDLNGHLIGYEYYPKKATKD
jgi:hypothetical protein